MFTYFHCYLPETWDAQVKAGLINEHSGIRFCESIDLDEEKKFNNLAKKGGELYNIIKKNNMPFILTVCRAVVLSKIIITIWSLLTNIKICWVINS